MHIIAQFYKNYVLELYRFESHVYIIETMAKCVAKCYS